LIADDAVEVRLVVAALLLRLGYRVHQAEDGEEAIAILRGCSGQIRFALIGVRMPGRDGRATAVRLREVAPEVPFAFMTGDSLRQIDFDELFTLGAVAVLPKPFTVQQIMDVVDELTRASAQGAGTAWRRGQRKGRRLVARDDVHRLQSDRREGR
jgi:CheY-like chemotaxis protein